MEYSISDWDRMQREAEQRVRASRARNAQRMNGSVTIPEFVKTREEAEHRQSISQHSSSSQPPKQKGLFDLLNLNNFELDGDRSMLLMILALLSGEKKDDLLTLALLYIML